MSPMKFEGKFYPDEPDPEKPESRESPEDQMITNDEMAETLTRYGVPIAKLTGGISQRSIAEQGIIVQNYSLREILDWLHQSGEDDWVQKPAFYRALSDALVHRLRIRTGK